MKWTNQGKEFEKRAKTIQEYEGTYAIWGAALAGEETFLRLQGAVTIAMFLDSNPKKTEYCGLPVGSPDALSSFSGKLIVASSAYQEIKAELEAQGRVENQDFFFWKTFLSLYFFYVENKLTLHRVDISLTNRCTLRCKYCNMFMPHFKNPEDQTLEQVKADLDNLFAHVDYVSSIKLLGGEPFLFGKLQEVVEYISQNYGTQMGYMEVFTNGTLVPTTSQLELLAKEGVRVQVTDYTKAVDYTAKLNKVIEKLKEYHIRHTFYSLEQWLDFGFPHNSSNVTGAAALTEKFDGCAPDFRGLVGNKLYFCHLSASAEKANLFQGAPSDYFLLEEGMEKASLLEFDLGYNHIGYVSFCRICRGCHSDIFVDGSQQLERGSEQ